MEKDGEGTSDILPQRASPSKWGLKPRPEAREKRSAQADPPARRVVSEPSAQPDEEEPEPMLMHRKQKLSDQASPQVGVVPC